MGPLPCPWMGLTDGGPACVRCGSLAGMNSRSAAEACGSASLCSGAGIEVATGVLAGVWFSAVVVVAGGWASVAGVGGGMDAACAGVM